MKISIKSVPPNFRRAGKEFTRNPIVMNVDDTTVAILQAEPMLTVEVIHVPLSDTLVDPCTGPGIEVSAGVEERPDNGDPGEQLGPSGMPPCKEMVNEDASEKKPFKPAKKGK